MDNNSSGINRLHILRLVMFTDGNIQGEYTGGQALNFIPCKDDICYTFACFALLWLVEHSADADSTADKRA